MFSGVNNGVIVALNIYLMERWQLLVAQEFIRIITSIIQLYIKSDFVVVFSLDWPICMAKKKIILVNCLDYYTCVTVLRAF